uniref:Putative trypsin-like serine protease n=1 Tax=Panstrongylus lignarius TaxID=156445 RepID=A0A224XQ00_9HEMI
MFIILFLLVKVCCMVTSKVVSIEVDPATIANASQFDIDEVPYIVSIQNTIGDKDKTKVCTGFFTGSNWILTSAHCFDGGKVTKTLIKFGINDYSLDTKKNNLESKGIFKHPEYNSKSLMNDLALIKVQLTDAQAGKAKYLLTDEYGFKWKKNVPGRNCMAVGFGHTKYNDPKLFMKELIVRYDPRACGCFATNRELLCGTNNASDSEQCFEDYGGPLICNGLVVGVANKILQCDENERDKCGKETYLRYTNLCAYFQWISGYVDSFPEECFGYRQGKKINK